MMSLPVWSHVLSGEGVGSQKGKGSGPRGGNLIPGRGVWHYPTHPREHND